MASYAISIASVEDAVEIFDVVNGAYDIEIGDSGISFKNVPRLVDPLEEQMQNGFDNKSIFKCVNVDTGKIAGILYFEFRGENLYFGPFAVDPTLKGFGIGKLLLRELKKYGLANNFVNFEIRVACHRSDLSPMYYKWGFRKIREEPYPSPERLTRPTYFNVLSMPIAEFNV